MAGDSRSRAAVVLGTLMQAPRNGDTMAQPELGQHQRQPEAGRRAQGKRRNIEAHDRYRRTGLPGQGKA